jgi:predicted MFS family arabinose efflux permease
MSDSPPSPASAGPAQAGPEPRLWTLTFLTFLAINFCIFLGFDMLLPTLSLYLDAQGCAEREIGLIFSAFAVSAVTSRLLAARFSRRFGPTRVLRAGLSICFLGSFMFFLLPHPLFYALARLLHGAGFGLTSTLMVAMAVQVIPPRRLGEGLGYLGLGATVALAAGPLVGLWIATAAGYRAMFTSIAFCYVAATLISLRLPPVRLASDSRPDSGGLKSFLEPRAFRPAALILMYGAAASSVSAFLAIYCQEAGLASAAGFFVVSTVGTVTSRLTAGRIYDRCGHLWIIPPGAVLSMTALLAIVLTTNSALLYAAAVVYGLGMGSLFPSVQALTLSSVPADRRTAASAIFFNAFDIGIGLGTILMGFMAGLFRTFSVIYLVSVAMILEMLAIYLFLYLPARPAKRTRTPRGAEPAAPGGPARPGPRPV